MKAGEPMNKTYRALRGLTYPASKRDLELRKADKPCAMKRVEAGEVAEGLPAESVPWLLADGAIEEVSDGKVRSR